MNIYNLHLPLAYGARHTQVPDIPATLARCLDGLASCAERGSVESEAATSNQASACSAATSGAGGSAETLWVRACCALLERAAPAARPGSLLQQARCLSGGCRNAGKGLSAVLPLLVSCPAALNSCEHCASAAGQLQELQRCQGAFLAHESKRLAIRGAA